MLLFSETVEVIVTTSANVPGLPMEHINESARKNLGNTADYYIFHNRDIYNPIDDSVTRVVKGEERIIRRARGYVPEPFNSKGTWDILACGSNSKNTFCIAKDGFLFLSQHNGNLENIETNENYKNNIEHFKRIFSFNPQYLACDMHPEYESSKYAESFDLPKVFVQHHHAHIASCMAENDVEGEVIGIAFDGTGYGTDGKIWGGEFLVCSTKEFKRAGHLNYVKMPGGEKAVKEPWRMGLAYILETLREDKDLNYKSIIENLWGKKSFDILKAIEADINCPETSSMGRFFDAVTSIIGLRDILSYDGQGAVELEALISERCMESYSYNINKAECYVLEVHNTIKEILEDISEGITKEILSSKFHNTVIKFTVDMCKLIRNDYGINKAALSGGVFQNAYLFENITKDLEKEGFIVYTHKNLPCNDGGLSLGQIIVADGIISSSGLR
ncbi:MAG: Sua5/YciO/YrdC/YwlC family protein, partial [Clostridiaceae bacterium]